MLHDAQRTSAPSALSVSISTAVWIVMCKEPAMRAPRSGCCGANSSRIAIRPGISVSAIAISLRPHAARSRSATLKSAKLRVSVTAFISHSLSGTAPWGRELRSSPRARAAVQRAPFQSRKVLEPGRAALGYASPACCNAPRGGANYSASVRVAKPRAVRLRSGLDGQIVGRLPLREQRDDQARFALVEPFGVERFLEREKLVVEVVAQFVDHGAQERLEGDDLPSLRRAHPDGDSRRRAALLGLVQAMQLAVAVDGPLGENPHAQLRHAISGGERVEQALAFALHRPSVVRAQSSLKTQHRRTVLLASRNAERGDAVAQAIDLLARRRKAVVIGERHRRISSSGRSARYCTFIPPSGKSTLSRLQPQRYTAIGGSL